MKEALLYKKLQKKTVQCTACYHYCTIQNGKSGICGIRKNEEGVLYLTLYGQTSGAGIDYIEKKPLFHFLPNTPTFSFGTIGCNFGCEFCQNAWMSQPTKDKMITVPPLSPLSPEEIVQSSLENNIPSISYTYNEPSIFFEYTYDTAKLAHKNCIKNIYVSNGYASPEAIDKIAPYLDAINIDLKAFSDTFYKKVCKARLEPVLKNIAYYYGKKIWIEITTLLIPGQNDSKKEVRSIAQFICSISKSIPWHITSFTPAYKMKNKHSTNEETIRQAYLVGKEAGLLYVYAGNIFGEDVQSTFCPQCKNLLIERNWGYTKIRGLKDGKCQQCKRKIEGVWK